MQPLQILCFGDSNTWGYAPVSADRYPAGVRWTGVMTELLGDRFSIIEEGQNGRTTVWDDPLEGGHKNGLTYLTACLESHHPIDLVILMLGTNDLKARFSLTALDIALGAERLVQTIQQSGWGPRGNAPAILLAAPPPVDPKDDLAEMFSGSKEKSVGLAQRYAEVAARCGCGLLDVGKIVAVDPRDGIHYSREAHRALGLAMASRVQSMFPE
jgi:lysophospholipase L1-like esterase